MKLGMMIYPRKSTKGTPFRTKHFCFYIGIMIMATKNNKSNPHIILDGYEDDILYIEDVTGTLGEWFDMNTDEIPTEALKALQTAYSICVKALEGGN